MRNLGKKAHTQDGTLTAFACDCISICNTTPCNCINPAADANDNAANMGKVVAKALSGSNFLWG